MSEKRENAVREQWLRRDKDIKLYFHRMILFGTCLCRLFLAPYILRTAHPVIQIIIYIIVENYIMHFVPIFKDQIPFTLNLWHSDHVARFVQLVAFAIFIAATNAQVEVIFGIWILHIYCWWFPDHLWIHVLTDIMIQHNLKVY